MSTRLATPTDFRGICRTARRHLAPLFPSNLTIRFRRQRCEGCMGWCDGVWDYDSQSGEFIIVIDPRVTRYHLHDLLVHEMAHVLQTIEYPDETEDHGQGFADCWVRIYKLYYGVS